MPEDESQERATESTAGFARTPISLHENNGPLAEIFRDDSVFYVFDKVMGDVFGAATFVLTVIPEAVRLCSSAAISVKSKRSSAFRSPTLGSSILTSW